MITSTTITSIDELLQFLGTEGQRIGDNDEGTMPWVRQACAEGLISWRGGFLEALRDSTFWYLTDLGRSRLVTLGSAPPKMEVVQDEPVKGVPTADPPSPVVLDSEQPPVHAEETGTAEVVEEQRVGGPTAEPAPPRTLSSAADDAFVANGVRKMLEQGNASQRDTLDLPDDMRPAAHAELVRYAKQVRDTAGDMAAIAVALKPVAEVGLHLGMRGKGPRTLLALTRRNIPKWAGDMEHFALAGVDEPA